MSGKGLHIVFIGFMGSGKTTVAKLVAEHLNRPFIDTDIEVMEREGTSISEIFDQKGESYFRKIENEILQSTLKSKIPAVIATGGGAPCFLNGMTYIRKYSFSFYLKVGRATLLNRIFKDKSRPLISTKTKQELMQFIDVSLRERETIYKKANRIILAYDEPQKIVDRIQQYLEKIRI
jgi:shikimate kinase